MRCVRTYESGLAHKTGTPHQLSIFVHDNIGVHVDAFSYIVTLTSILNRMLSMDPVIAFSSVSPEQF